MQDSIKASHSPFDVELFSTRVQWVVFVCACVIVFALNLWQEYRAYREFSTKENKEIYAQVINQYTKHKNGKTYEVLKLKTKQGEIFYTTSREDIKDLSHRFVRIYGKGLECSFVSYLQHCFFVSYRISLLNERDYRDFLREWIETQHTESAIASLYKTLFMADALPSIWRDLSARLGIAHLIAISGFHLGILSFVLGWILSSIYRIFHHRLSYRNKYFDVGFMVLVGLFAYLLLLDFTPSFLRAFTMAVCGFLVVYSGIKLFSFRLLVVVVCVCVAFFPRLIFSIGFGLSVSGVFFIYLFVKYVRLDSKVLYVLLFNTLIFFDMLPLTHWFFPYFTSLSLLSIPISLLFVVFFPAMLIAHIVGVGALCDEFLQWAMNLQINSIEFYTPWWFLCIFTLCAIGAIYTKRLYYTLHLLALLFFGYMVYKSV
ncbi:MULTISPECIES: ComEC/Rec2 family competence protein [Helicobacter]|uniref:ComEC/Rec2 family competence protein n=6 Tax=Helicobacter typhlonius TaxID=76936 RepID=A0A0S4PWU2_9HELI|nr:MULTISPECIES: ComEC/Rec2 family competence protein [Helicobacter]TLD78588.1 ComEC/Rec2 family competence protein [Helicobacter typhlonius]TLD89340.1 ComEC/Rec2 family competence protein [Helicobacter sp. MIT 03-1616]CUU40167.1 FIG00712137: Hypothetical protein [Helicobacter typhlonius]